MLYSVIVLLIVSLLDGGIFSFGIDLLLKFNNQYFTSAFENILNGASTVLFFVTMVVSGPLAYGAAKLFLKQARDNEPMVIEDVFCGFKEDFKELFLIHFISSIKASLWGLLFIVPGIVKGLAYSMSYYIKADNPDYSWRECLSESEKIMNGHKGEFFVLQLSFIGWDIVGFICCGIGMYWVMSYENATAAHFYESIKEADNLKGASVPAFEETE
ncbi:MAG: DUF975 family protein [Acutalibacteraceae bacterium]